MCRTTVIFGTLKGGSLEINSFSYRNVLITLWVVLRSPIHANTETSSKMASTRFVKNAFTSMWSKYLSNNVWRDFRLLMSALATVALKSLRGVEWVHGLFLFPLVLGKM